MKTNRMPVLVAALLLLALAACNNQRPETASRSLAYPTSLRDAVLRRIVPPALPGNSASILEFGAVGDSAVDCKPAFDKAMQACKDRGGLRIVVPAGVYRIDGPIHLESNVCLDLHKGARLVFSSNPSHYLPVVPTSWEGTFLFNYSPFIYGYRLSNVSIVGEGVIDGNASGSFALWTDLDSIDQQRSREMNHTSVPVRKRIFGNGHFLRPQLIQFYDCRNILVEGVTLEDSPFWCLHLLRSQNITVRGIRFHAYNKNNDGIDPEYSRDILIEDVVFDNADDNVAIKAGRDHEGRSTAIPSENIVVRRCSFKGLHGVVIGSEMSAGVRNVFVEDCSTSGYLKRGIYLKSNPDRGGFIRRIFVKNVQLGEVEDAFYITSHYHGEGQGHATKISEVLVDGLTCRKATGTGLVIQGFPQKPIERIYFNRIRIDSVNNSVSFTDCRTIVLGDVVVGREAGVPSLVK